MNSSRHFPRRIIVAHSARLLRGMLRRVIERSPHLQLVGEAQSSRGLSALIQETDAEWVILSLAPDGSIPDRAKALLEENPSVAVLAVALDGSRLRVGWTEATALENRPVRVRWTAPDEELLANLSLDELILILCKDSYLFSSNGA